MVWAVFTSMSVSVQGFAVKIITQPENETILIKVYKAETRISKINSTIMSLFSRINHFKQNLLLTVFFYYTN